MSTIRAMVCEALDVCISDDTVGSMVKDCDLILDGTDNIDTRKALNRAALNERIPFIFGGVDGFDGMLTSFIPGKSACLECIFPGTARRSKKEIGVIGPAAGVIASLQSVEAVKLLTGNGTGLAGVLVHFHGLEMRSRLRKEIGLCPSRL